MNRMLGETERQLLEEADVHPLGIAEDPDAIEQLVAAGLLEEVTTVAYHLTPAGERALQNAKRAL